MIGISTFDYDPSGSLLLRERVENPFGAVRRGSVTATLDGGSVSYDTGFSVSDTTFRFSISHTTKTVLQQLQYLIAYYPELRLCCESGCFRGILAFPQMNGGTAALEFRVLEQLNR